MALTDFQRHLCRLIAGNRKRDGDSYVAGGVALNTLLGTARRSRDVDLFHDTDEALARSWSADRATFEGAGLHVEVLREAPAFVEALVAGGPREKTLVQWVRDSAYRFFPLLENETFGLVLHPFDLATNKALAMASRLEPRDWIDLIESQDRLAPLGYLIWAACGKDPGYGPGSLLEEVRRHGRYSQVEIDELDFDGPPPSAQDLGRRWHDIVRTAAEVIALLPGAQAGRAVVHAATGDLCREAPQSLRSALASGAIGYHEGTIGGVWPSFKPAP